MGRFVSRTGLLLALVVWLVSAPLGAAQLPDFTDLVEANAPTVVNISTIQKSALRTPHGRLPDFPQGTPFDEWFKKFFGDRGGDSEEGGDQPRARSLGSGFIISSDGYILTNEHVVEDADKIIVRLNDRRELEAEVVGIDDLTDLALLKIDAENLPVAKIGRSEEVKPGQWVLAIGSPFGFDYSVTAGIVSAVGRSLPRENYVPFIQTDVAINPGNSGGPLINLKGEVIGINSQIYSQTGGYMGLSFAIPIDVAMNVVEQLKTTGHVARGWLGVLIQDVTRDLAESFGMDRPRGALVAKVMPDSPAEKAGIQVGDVIVEFDGHEIIRSSDLPPLVGVTRPGTTVKVKVIRDGRTRTIKVTVGELPEEEIQARETPKERTIKDLALSVTDLTEEQKKRLGEDVEGGVLVTRVKPGPARDAGIQRGDVIVMIDNRPVKDVKGFEALLDELPRGRSVPVLVMRRGSPIFLALRIPR